MSDMRFFVLLGLIGCSIGAIVYLVRLWILIELFIPPKKPGGLGE